VIAAAFGLAGCSWLRALVDIPLTSKEVAIAVRDALAALVRLARRCSMPTAVQRFGSGHARSAHGFRCQAQFRAGDVSRIAEWLKLLMGGSLGHSSPY
jgi:hypothetical protein